MSEREKSKGISLRKKRDKDKKKTAPTISVPRQISAPMPAGASIAPSIASSNRPSTESSRSRQNRGDVPQQRPQRADKTADLVKRRYSQKITTLPSDFGNGPMPDMPQIPSQYRDKSQTRDVRPPANGGEGRPLRLDMKALHDPNLRAEQCESHLRFLCVYVLRIARCIIDSCRRFGRRHPPLSRRAAQNEAPYFRGPPDQCVPEQDPVY